MVHAGLLTIIHTVLLQAFLAVAPAPDDFKLVKRDGTLSLYERWIASRSGDKVREIKAVFSVRSRTPDIIHLLKDAAKGKEWNPDVRTYQVVGGTDQHRWMTYIQYDFPWPIEDQDCLLVYHYQGLGDRSVEISFESALHNQFPVSRNVTRITGTRGKWLLEPQSEEELRITYIITTDRSKKIPRWVSDPIVHSHLFKTMSKFKSLLETTAHE